MSNVIAFLESMGKTAGLTADSADYAAAVDALQLDDVSRHALLTGDHATLAEILGARPKMICALFPAEDQPEEEQPVVPDGEEPGDTKESAGRLGRH